MKVYLSIEEKVITVPPDQIPAFYTQNKWRLVFSEEKNMYVTAPPGPSNNPPMSQV